METATATEAGAWSESTAEPPFTSTRERAGTESPRTAERAAQAADAGNSPTVSLAALLDQVGAFLRRYVVFSADAQAVATTLWIAHTHPIDAFDVSPYLGITSAEKGSGKSRLLELLELLVARAWRMVSPTEAVVFRKIDAASGAITVLFDEGDAVFSQVAEGLRSILNAGHRRGAVVSRCGDPKAGYPVKDFNVFCPKAIAAIGELPGTIADRSIPIQLRRRTKAERVERFRFGDAQTAAVPLRTALEAWAPMALATLRTAQPAVPEALNDRAAEGWEPLFAIADLAGGDWPERARAAAVALHAHSRDDDSIGIQLLRAIDAVFREQDPDAPGLPTRALLKALDEREGEPWHDALRIGPRLDWLDPTSPINGSASRLANLLRPYGIQPRDVRDGATVRKAYYRADFADAFARFLSDQEDPQ